MEPSGSEFPQFNCGSFPDQSREESMNICAMHNLYAPRLGIGFNRVYSDGGSGRPFCVRKIIGLLCLREHKFLRGPLCRQADAIGSS
jgi:hypothetical protein